MSESVNMLFEMACALANGPQDRFVEFADALRALDEVSPEAARALAAKVGLGRRKAYYLLEIADMRQRMAVPAERLRGIGWTKASLLARYLTPKNREALLTLAETRTVRDLEILLAGGEVSGDQHCVLLYFSAGQYTRLSKALLSFGAMKAGRGLVGKEKALMKLIAAFAKAKSV